MLNRILRLSLPSPSWQVGSKRMTPTRQGTGREITARPVQFRKRVIAAVELPPVEKPQASDNESSEEAAEASLEMIVRRGRRTGLRMKKEVTRDTHGLERLSEFWIAEEESTRLSLVSVSDSAATDGSVVSHRSSAAGADSFAENVGSIDGSAETHEESMSDATPASTDRSRNVSRSATSSFSKSRTTASATPSSAGRSSTRTSSA